jgi:hypothetical protein
LRCSVRLHLLPIQSDEVVIKRRMMHAWRSLFGTTGASIQKRTVLYQSIRGVASSGPTKLEDPRQRRYVDALRTVISAAPPTGCNAASIASGLEALLGEDGEPSRFGFGKLSHALKHLQDEYYIINRDTLMPCDLGSALRRVRLSLPVEGVLLPAFVRHVAHVCRGFEEYSIPGYSVEQWIQERWHHLFSVVPHEINRTFTVFRRLEIDKSRKVQQIERALSLLNRSPDLPVYTNVEAIVPLLPHRGNTQSWPVQLLTKGDIAEAFDYDVDLMLRLPIAPLFDVFVDGTAVSPLEVRRALDHCHNEALSAAVSAGSLTSSSEGEADDEATLRMRTVRFKSRDAHGSDNDIVVDAFLSIADEIVAAVAACLSGARSDSLRNIVLVVGDKDAESYRDLIQESLPPDAVKAITICTPRRMEFPLSV